MSRHLTPYGRVLVAGTIAALALLGSCTLLFNGWW